MSWRSFFNGSSVSGLSQWKFQVYSARLFESGDPSAPTIEADGVTKHVEVQELEVEDLLGPFQARTITAYSEWRMKFSEWQWSTGPVFYHAFLFLEVQGGFAISTEKYSDQLELVLGREELLRSYTARYHSNGIPRRSSFQQPRQELDQVATVGDLMKWISGPLAMVWKPYDLFFSNCQGYVADVIAFFNDPTVAERLCEDREIMRMVVQRDGLMLRFASLELRKDWDLVRAAVTQNGLALRYADRSLRKDSNMASLALSQTGLALQHVTAELRRDFDMAMAAVRKDGAAIQFVSNSLKRDRELLQAALHACGGDFALLFSSDNMKGDREVAIMAVRMDGGALRHLSPALKQDREVVRIAAQQRGGLEQLLIDPHLCSDRNVMLAAVSISGFALQYATEDLRSDPEVVLAAVHNNRFSLQFSPPEVARLPNFAAYH